MISTKHQGLFVTIYYDKNDQGQEEIFIGHLKGELIDPYNRDEYPFLYFIYLKPDTFEVLRRGRVDFIKVKGKNGKQIKSIYRDENGTVYKEEIEDDSGNNTNDIIQTRP